MARFTAVYDACVLYPAPLRDLLVRLANTGLFRARWTEEIHDEWTLVIVTFNLCDFPANILNRYSIEAQHPDEFLTHLFDLRPEAVCAVVREQREDLRHPPQTVAQLLETLEKQGIPMTTARLREMSDLL